MAHAHLARKRAAKDADHFRCNAEEFRKQADRAPTPEIKERLLRVAASHERLAELAERIKQQMPVFAGDSVSFLAGRAEESMKERSVEGPLAQARRHVAEGEDRIARQEALVVKLSKDRKHAVLAAEAREILETLKRTLSLAREHLANELRNEAAEQPSGPADAA